MVVFGRPKGRRGSYRQWEEDNIPPQVVFEILSPGNNANVFTVFGPTSQSQGIYKVALGYKSGDSALYINGTQAATNSSSFTFNAALVIAAMHGTTAGANTMNDRIRAAAIYTTRLSNAQLAELTRL